MEQVPEVCGTKMSTQIDYLKEKLFGTGNKAFAALRGRFSGMGTGDKELGFMGEIAFSASSPTQFCKDMRSMFPHFLYIGDMLARFRRDGWKYAEEELTKALTDASYCLPGEIVPLHETRPLTVLIFDFQRTLTMIKWLQTGSVQDLEKFYTYFLPIKKGTIPSMEGKTPSEQLCLELFQSFPRLGDDIRICYEYKDTPGWHFLSAYYDLLYEYGGIKSLIQMGYRLTHPYEIRIDGLEFPCDDRQLFGLIVEGDQKDVLSRFSREQQKSIASWMIRVPKNSYIRQIGFHPEIEHCFWENKANAYPSKGCQYGFGAVGLHMSNIEPEEYVQRYGDAHFRFMLY